MSDLIPALAYRPKAHDDWGAIRTETGEPFAFVRGALSKDEEREHRANDTDPFEELAIALIRGLKAPRGDSLAKAQTAMARLREAQAFHATYGDCWRDGAPALIDAALQALIAQRLEIDALRGNETLETVPAILHDLTFVVQYNPNCVKPWLVRLPGKNVGVIDLKPYAAPRETKDALGFGVTFEEAASAAVAALNAP